MRKNENSNVEKFSGTKKEKKNKKRRRVNCRRNFDRFWVVGCFFRRF